MHELALTQEIISVARERAGAAQVTRVVIEIGRLTAVLPDAVRSCFRLCVEDTPLRGAELVIIETPGAARCRACGGQVQLDQPLGCCSCGSRDLEWLAGQELRIREIEVI